MKINEGHRRADEIMENKYVTWKAERIQREGVLKTSAKTENGKDSKNVFVVFCTNFIMGKQMCVNCIMFRYLL